VFSDPSTERQDASNIFAEYLRIFPLKPHLGEPRFLRPALIVVREGVFPSPPERLIGAVVQRATPVRKGWLMNISTTARQYDLAPALKDYAEDKVQNLKRYFDHIVTAHLVFSLEKYRHKVEISLHVNGKDFVSEEESDDMYVSVDRSIEKLERQLRRHKDKIKRRKAQQSVSDLATQDAGETAEDEDYEEEEAPEQ
jgi:putative sigma-54 modulation protein